MELYVIYSIVRLLSLCGCATATMHCPALSQDFSDFGIDFCKPSSLLETADDVAEFLKEAKCQGYGDWNISPSIGCKSPVLTHGMEIEYPCGCDFGAKCHVKCHYEYTLKGSEIIVCLKNGSYSKLPTCVKKRCEVPVLPSKLILNPSCKFEEGENCTITCTSSEYRLYGVGSIKCDHAHWSEYPKCDYFCRMSEIPSAIKTDDSCEGNEKQICKPSCRNPNLTMTGQQILGCIGGRWSIFPVCGCNLDVLPQNIKLKRDCVMAAGEYCDAECGWHYYRKGGNSRIFCGLNGVWDLTSQDAIQCLKECHVPELPQGVIFKKPCPRVQFGEVCEVQCIDRIMKLSGPATFRCLETGRYSTMSACAKTNQCSPGLISHTIKFTGDCLHVVGESCSVGCVNEKATLTGPSSITCMESGSWSAFVECKLFCPPFPRISYFEPTNCARVEEKKYCDVKCKRKYTPTEKRHVKCLEGGKWPSELLTCVINCGFPPLGNKVILKEPCTYNENDICIPVCESDSYVIRPKHLTEIKCLPSGTWTRKPICNVVCRLSSHNLKLLDTCYQPMAQEESCRVECKNSSNVLLGNNIVWCRRDGMKGAHARCVTPCAKPSGVIPDYLEFVKECKNTLPHLVCEMKCKDPRATMIGKFMCYSGGRWSKFPKCEFICPIPHLNAGTRIEGFCKAAEGSRCKIVCNNARETFPMGRTEFYIQCTNGAWSEMPTCRFYCSKSDLSPALQFNTDCFASIGESCNVVCVGNLYLMGKPSLSCTESGWSMMPQCMEMCPLPHLRKHMIFDGACIRIVGNSCKIKCIPPIARIVGPEEIHCQRAGNELTWSIFGHCVRGCPSPYIYVGTSIEGICRFEEEILCKIVCDNPNQKFRDGSTEIFIECKNGVWSSRIPCE